MIGCWINQNRKLLLRHFLQSNNLASDDMGRAPKSSSCDQSRCRKHVFTLKPLRKGLYFPKIQRGKFCPKFSKQNNSFTSILPTINGDKKEYTPFFILEEQKQFYTKNDQKLKISHENRIKECGEKSQLLVPRHVRKRQFCSVCKAVYEEYLDHIENQEHKKNLRNCKYNAYIDDLVKLLKEVNKREDQITVFDEPSWDIEKFLSEPTGSAAQVIL